MKAVGIRRADGTNCHGCGSSSSVCVDGWFILGAMIALMHHRCAAPPSQSPISLTQARWGCKPVINNTHSTYTLHSYVEPRFGELCSSLNEYRVSSSILEKDGWNWPPVPTINLPPPCQFLPHSGDPSLSFPGINGIAHSRSTYLPATGIDTVATERKHTGEYSYTCWEGRDPWTHTTKP